MSNGRGMSRRGFLKGVGVAAVSGGAALPAVVLAAKADEALAEDGPEVLGPGPVPVKLRVNGKTHELKLEPRTTLLDAIRGPLGLTGPKEVCDRGACGACTVLLNGKTVCSCMTLALDADGADVTTVEGFLGPDGAPSDLQQQFAAKDALQCGYCTCGMVTASEAVLRANPNPTRDDVRSGISGNLCRCGTYTRIVDAVIATAALRRKGK